MLNDPTLAPLRAGLVFLGGAFAWMVAMAGWFFNPHRPEIKSVKRIYSELAALVDSVVRNSLTLREKTVLALNDADATLLAGYVSWKSSKIFKQLYLLKEQANSILLDILEMAAEGRLNLPPAVGETVQALADSLDQRQKSVPMKILQPKETDQAVDRLFSKIYNADAIMNEPISRINQDLKITKPTLHQYFFRCI